MRPTWIFMGLISLLFLFSPVFSSDSLVKIFVERPNTISFAPVSAKFVRVRILATNGGEPCFDELEVYRMTTAEPENASTENAQNSTQKKKSNQPQNLALLSGVTVSASSVYPNMSYHQVVHLNDQRFGNNFSWISKPGEPQPWVQYEWQAPVTFDSIVFSRDRTNQFQDRVVTQLEVQISQDGQNWETVAQCTGFVSNQGTPGRANYFTNWLQSVPGGNPLDLSLITTPPSDLTEYDQQLRKAILGEENAWLKVSGFADIDRWVLRHGYPERVEPKDPVEDILPLPTCAQAPSLESSEDVGWKFASTGTVRVCRMDNWNAGALVEQTVSALIHDHFLYVKIQGNRFLSEHLAMISTESQPARGLILYRDGQLFWRCVDPIPGHQPEDLVPLEGHFDPATLTLTARVPLEYFPETLQNGLLVTLGIGGNNTMAGGHPVHFVPADFSLSKIAVNADGQFMIRLCATGAQKVTLSAPQPKLNASGQTEIQESFFSTPLELQPGETKEILLPARFGLIGPEYQLAFDDDQQNTFQATWLRYDPCYRVESLMKDMLIRLSCPNPETMEKVHFKKTIAIQGAINPLYTDLSQELSQLKEEYAEELNAEIDFDVLADDEVYGGYAQEYLQLVAEHRQRLSNPDPMAERELFWKMKDLKRRIFLNNEELASLTTILANKRHPFWPSHNYSDLVDSQWKPGGAVVLLHIPRTEKGLLEPNKATCDEIISANDGVIRNPSMSFDATKIYYASRVNKDEYFRIMEYDLATGQTRRISPEGPFHDFWPTPLPDGTLAFVTTRCTQRFLCWIPQAFVLYKMNLDGTNLQRLSFANLTEFAPSVKDDGRIQWTRSEYVDKGADYGHTLWTIRIDGTMPELVFGNTINLPQGYANGRDVPETREVCTTMISHFGDLNGPIALLDLMKGPHDPSANHSITPEVPWPGYWSRIETFREAFPLTRDILLVAHAPQDRFGLFFIDRYGNRELLSSDPQIDTVCPQPLQARDVPPILVGSSNPALAEQKMGQFSIANVYRGLEDQVEPGSAKYLRICQELPATLEPFKNPDGTYPMVQDPFEQYYASPTDILQGAYGWPSFVAKGVIGTVKIEEDGSADFLAPAEKVLFFQLLDENFNEIQRMRSVVQLQNGEQRSCIGCHESRLSTPDTHLTLAGKNPPQTPTAPAWGSGPFWFEKVVQPVFDQHCVQCHTQETMAQSPRQIDLTGTLDANNIPASYRSMIQSGTVHYFDYTWSRGLTTKAPPYSFGTWNSLLWTILKDEHHQEISLTSQEEQAIKCWIDLNVPLWGNYSFRPTRHSLPEASTSEK